MTSASGCQKEETRVRCSNRGAIAFRYLIDSITSSPLIVGVAVYHNLVCKTASEMPVILHMRIYRKSGITSREFRDHYENVHLPLMRKISGELFPESHTRRYISFDAGQDTSECRAPAQILAGSPSHFDFAAISEIIYRDMDHFEAHSALLQSKEHKTTVSEDCEKFMDVTKTVMILLHSEDIMVTLR